VVFHAADQHVTFGPDIQVKVLSVVPFDGDCMKTERILANRNLSLIAVELEAAFVLSLAIDLVAGILSIRSHHGDSCCLFQTSAISSKSLSFPVCLRAPVTSLTFWSSLITFLLPPPASHTSGLRAIAEIPLSLLWIRLR